MPTNLSRCAEFLRAEGVRHHVDVAEAAIRIVFVTQRYRNPRDEKLSLLRLETPDDGHRCRVSIERAFLPGANPATTCLQLCRLAAATPLVAVEYDEDFANLRMVVESVVEDGEITQLQLLSMVDRLVEAAEWWHEALERLQRRPRSANGVSKRPAAERRTRVDRDVDAA